MNIDRQVEAIIAAGIPLGEAEARVVAGWWHGGASSALYAFASSGYADKGPMERELSRINPATAVDASHTALVAYVDALPDVALTFSFDNRDEYDAVVYGTEPSKEEL